MKRKEIYELDVKNILVNIYSERYNNLLKSESPDFHNDSIGLEITTASNQNDMENIAIYDKYANENKSIISPNLLKKIENKIYLIFDKDKLIGYRDKHFIYSFSIIKEIGNILNKKLEKLNTNYTLFQYNDLAIQVRDNFVFCENCDSNFEKEIINQFLTLLKEAIKNVNIKYNKNFDLVHIVYDNILITINEKKIFSKIYNINNQVAD